jgi:hypothetical protein
VQWESGSVRPVGERKNIYPFAAVGLAAFLAYLATLSANYLGDGVQFAAATESADVSLMPNHMLYNASIFGWYRVWKLLGWTGNAILPLQVFSAFWGALSVALFWLLIMRITGAPKVTGLVTFGFGTCFAVWLFSTDVEVVTFPLALSVLLLVVAITSSDSWFGRPFNAAVTGLLTSVSILSYQTGVFMVPAVGLAYVLRDLGASASKRRLIAVYLITVLVVVSGCCLWVARAAYHVSTLKGFIHWQFFLKESGLWGGFTGLSIPTGMFGFVRTISSFPGLSYIAGIRTFFMFAPLWQKALLVCYYAVLSAMGVYVSLKLFVRWRTLFGRYRLPLALFAVSGLLYAAFALYWIPADIQFWVPVVASWWGAIGLLLAFYSEEGRRNGRSRIVSSGPGAAAVALICIMSFVNFFGTILPNTNIGNNIEYNVAAGLKDMAKKNDLIITSGADRLALYIPYFFHKNVLSIFLLGMQGGSGEGLLSEIDRRINDAVSAGNDVYFVGMKPGRFVLWKEMNRLGVDQSFVERYDATVCARVCGEEILKLKPWEPKGMIGSNSSR